MPTNNKTAKRNIDKTIVIVDALQGMMTRRRQQAYKEATADADAAGQVGERGAVDGTAAAADCSSCGWNLPDVRERADTGRQS